MIMASPPVDVMVHKLKAKLLELVAVRDEVMQKAMLTDDFIVQCRKTKKVLKTDKVV